jgi:hypothetical protein
VVDVDTELYYWITVANESRERFGLAPGVVESLVAHLKGALGPEFLAAQLEKSKRGAGLMSESLNPLRTWLHGPSVDKHVIQLLELAALLKAFDGDPCRPDKIVKIKQDALWPIMFELAMASRLKSLLGSNGEVGLCCEHPDAVGDFYIVTDNKRVACECSRLGYPPEEEEQFRILDDLYRYIGEFVKGKDFKRCIKIKVSESLTGQIFNPRLVAHVKKANQQFERTGNISGSSDASIDVLVEPLTDLSEKIPFAMVDGRVTDVAGSDWTSATSICSAVAENDRHLADMYRTGQPFQEIEHTRVFIRFPRAPHRQGAYERLNRKIKSKLGQTKLPNHYLGRLVFIEWTVGLDRADAGRIQNEILDRVKHTSRTLGVIVTSRHGTPRYRHHFASTGSLNKFALVQLPAIGRMFTLFHDRELMFDPITGERYVDSWEDARLRAKADQEVADARAR